MGKEIELKYALSSAAQADEILSSEFVLSELDAPIRTIRMSSTYYDTLDGRLIKEKISLRRRQENDEVVYTVKTPKFSDGALSARGEWQVVSDNFDDALTKLRECGAPGKLFELIGNSSLIPCAQVDFIRKSAPLKVGAEICLDVGTLGKIPFAELELELLPNGDADVLIDFGKRCATEFSLKAQPLSKFARARAFFSPDSK